MADFENSDIPWRWSCAAIGRVVCDDLKHRNAFVLSSAAVRTVNLARAPLWREDGE